MSTRLQRIILAACMFPLVWCAGSFASWNVDPGQWSPGLRIVLGLLALGMAGMVLVVPKLPIDPTA